MKAVLKKAVIRNFKGINSITVTFNPEVTNINGDNASCKSSIYDACMWCLTGKMATLEEMVNPLY